MFVHVFTLCVIENGMLTLVAADLLAISSSALQLQFAFGAVQSSNDVRFDLAWGGGRQVALHRLAVHDEKLLRVRMNKEMSYTHPTRR